MELHHHLMMEYLTPISTSNERRRSFFRVHWRSSLIFLVDISECLTSSGVLIRRTESSGDTSAVTKSILCFVAVFPQEEFRPPLCPDCGDLSSFRTHRLRAYSYGLSTLSVCRFLKEEDHTKPPIDALSCHCVR